MLTGNQRFTVSIFVTILIVLGTYNIGYTEVTPVSERTSQVRDAIVAEVPGVDAAADVTETHLGAITSLNLRAKSISALNSGDFSGLTGLTNLNLYGNELSSLPDGIFEGLTALTTLRLGGNSVDPMPITVSLEKVADGQFKAVVPIGALFAITVPISVTNGTITGGVMSVTIPQGSSESDTLTITRTAGTTADVTVDIGTLPSLPRNHYGYALVKSDDLPLAVITSINIAPGFTDGTAATRFVVENTAAAVNIGTPIIATDADNDTLTYTLGGTDASAFDIDSSTGHLKTKAALDYETKNSYTVTITVSDGSLTDTITVTINVTNIPEFLEGDITTRVVLENTSAGTNIGMPVNANDANNDFLTYTLSGVDADAFDIDTTNGQLKTKSSLDYETKRVYLVTLTVADDELADTITLIISVFDVNDTVVSAGFVPVAARTPQVRDAIVAAVPNVTDAVSVTESQVAAITRLNLRSKGISSLKTGDFSGMTALANLNLFSNQLSKLPPRIFDGLTALTALRLGGNVFDPLPLIVSLQNVGPGEFRAVITTSAPFSIVLPINVTNGSISGGATSVTIPQGSAESASFTLIGTSAKVSFGTLPRLPINHFGYTFAQSTACNRTTEVADAIAKAVGVNDCSAVTEVDLATITRLDLSDKSIASLQSDDFDGMLSLTTLFLSNNDLTSLTSGIFSNLTSLTHLYLQNNDLSSLSSSVLDGLSSLRHVGLEDNELTSLSGSIFDGIPNVSSILLSNNNLTSLPAGIFEGLTQLSQLHLSWNPNPNSLMSLTVSLQKVGINQFKAVVPTGAPFAMALPVIVQNGTIAGGATTITIPMGKVESQPLTVTRTSGTVNALTVNIGTPLPRIPATHTGYAFVKSTTLPIEILPPLNSTPIFTEGVNTIRTVAEKTAVGVNIGDLVAATDRDANTTLTYTLSGTDAAAFDMDSTNGQLKTKAALDFETKASYTVIITVSDGLADDTINVSIVVTDIDENRAPVFTEGESTTRTVAENTVGMTNIGTPIAATDADEDTLTFSLSGPDAAAFGIDTATGQLKTAASLDYENKSTYTVTITASDGTDETTITVTINVINKTENRAPVFTAGTSTSLSIAENTGSGVDIGSAVSATDADGNTLSYSLSGTDASSFSIDSTTGQLRTEAPLDYETKSTYTVTITASDGTDETTITVTINVINKTENRAPVFTAGTSTSLSIAENTGSGVDIGSAVSATDADGNTLSYSLGGTDASSFSIDSTTGQIRTSASLDYETQSTYTVTLTVSDGSLTDSINVTINITDVDETPSNNSPVFDEGSSTSRTVVENTGSGVDIGSAVSATDADGNTLSYSLGGTDASSFSIDSTTGQIRTSASLDYETQSTYTVTLTVSDGSLTDSINVTINITDVDETPSNSQPVFSEGSSTTRSVAENTGSGVDIGSAVSATDADGNTLSYSLGGTDASSFSIDSTTGQIRTSASLDYETQSTYTVTLTVSDGSLTDSINVTINITDVDETPSNNSPVFDEGSSTSRTVVENTGAGVDIGSAVSATDADGNTLSYSLSGTDASSFSIDSTSGQLQTSAALDYETKTTYTVTVSVSDENGGSDSITVTINVTDVDENSAPTFTDGTSTTRSIAENAPADTNIGAAISATDLDADTLAYTLSGTDASSFSIDTATGQLKTSATLDYETKTSYTITVSVSDGNGGSDSITVTINVTDVDENSAPTFTDGTSTTRSIAENAPADTNIGAAISATDLDADTLAYTLSGTDASSFSIDTATGQLKTSATLDYETKTSYTITVSVSDGNGGSDSITVTINVTDVDENSAPTFTDGTSTTRSIAENAPADTNIGAAISATDLDDDTLAYTLSGTDASSFSIDTATGQLKTSATLDYETKTSYTITVSVSDGNGGGDSINVTINVTNVSENLPPIFTDGANTTRSIAENVPPNTNIATAVAATDPNNDTLTYTLGGTDAVSFGINSTSGQLRTSAVLDFETKTTYTVTIAVSDGTLTDTIAVTINVTDVNEAPTFTDGANTTRSIAENAPADTNIGAAGVATDPDNDELTYSLGGTDAASFSVDSATGQLKTNAALDFETKTTYTVTIAVSDGTLTDTIAVTINVTDVNEAPTFTDGAITTRSIAENAPADTNIGAAVVATDPDNDELTYSLGGTDAASFSVDSATGQLKTNAALDFETKTTYTVTIAVSDGTLTDTITVTINITDLDETPSNVAPVFTEGETTTRSIAENTTSNTNIGTPVAATDVDNNTLAYLLSGAEASSFSIDSGTGQLKTSAALNYEDKSSYSVTITVSDGTFTDTITVTINVTDANDAPIFTDGTSTTRSVAENTVASQNIGSAVAATDADSGNTLTYTLGGTDAASFSIGSTNGQLRTEAALDYETKNAYSVMVTVSDGSLTDTINVTINVTDVDENRAPVFTDGGSTTREVAENTGSGANIGSAVSATDADDDTLEYTLGGTDAASFDIVSTSGQLQTKAALDYETQTSYSVTVSVSDGKGGSDSITVTINVTDVNENRAPVFTEDTSTTREVAENTGSGVNIGNAVSATDADDDTLEYTLGGTDAASFDIVSTSGQLQTKAALDYETQTSYSVTVSVSDGKGGSDSITVTISVTDVNENRAPVFTEDTSTTREVAENTGSGVNIGNAVSATDADDDTLEYTLGGTDAASFDIVSTSGQLQTKAALDYETQTSYSVTVSVSDGKGGSDSITVTISVTDVNENRAPVFTDGENTTREVAENTGSGANIGSAVSATDADDDTLEYTLGGTDAASFDIVSTSGQLQTKAALDYETQTSYSVTVSVSDGKGGSDSITVTISVTDVDENRAPVFTEDTSTTREVAENTGSGANIGSAVSATDADDDTLEYTLGGTDESSFSIDSTTGQLRTNVALDYETKTSYSVTVSVSDGKGGSDSITVTINVTDVDENRAPVFTDGTSTTRSVAENTGSGANIGTAVAATDADSSDTLTYSLGGTDASSFSINSATGQLRTSASLDYETKNAYSVMVTVSDGSLTDTINVTINVTDVDENRAPVFTDGESTTRSIAENTGSGVNIGNVVAATDADNNTLTYTLGGTDAASFSIGSTNGQLRTEAALDYETKNAYSVMVTVSDGSLTDIINVTINVTDVNENRAPVFTDGESTTRSIAENTGSGVNIGNVVAATDADNNTLTYTLGGTDAASFSIGSTNGQLRTEAALDYETKNAYSVMVTVSDGSLTDIINVTINVTDVNENRAPVFTDGESTTRSIAENTGSGVNIGNVVAATDADNNTLTYTLGGTDAASFSIGSTNGQLRTEAALDYETKNAYSVMVTVSDGSLTDTINVTINVTDVNENRAPVFTDGTSTTRSVAENTGSGVNIGNAVAATDADSSDTLTYSLGGTDASSFSINSATGQLRTSASLDYETKNAYSVTVTVSDGSLTDTINVTINVTDVDENSAPVFTDGTTTTRDVAENTASGQNIGSAVVATDADTGDTLTYTLGGTDAASFSIGSTNGQLRTEAALDYETKNAYSVMVTVSDGSLTDTINVTINVTDVDENSAPVFTDGTTTTRDVAENTASGQNIGTAVAATDADSSDTLTYSLGGTDASSFSINSATGQLRTSASLDYETKNAYSVMVTVSDGSLTDTINVTINVTDVDENRAPVFTDGTTTTRDVAENTASGQNIGSAVVATDADNNTLTYTLGGTDAASFSIGSTNGQLRTEAALDYETKNAYSVMVTVSDGSLTDTINVTINVTDVDENSAPVFTDGTTTTRDVAENTASGQNIGSAVVATDADTGDTLTYTLDGIDAGSFSIVGTSGQLQTRAALDYETKNTYTVIVSVSDGNSGTNSITVTINVTDVTENISITPVSERTQQVQDAIVGAVPAVSSAADVTEEHLASITYLGLYTESITSLKAGDFDGLINLTLLYLDENSISDISPLSGLTSLRELWLNDNSIIDISPLSGLTSLRELWLNDNSIIDISPLEGLTNLTLLHLNNNSIIDISPLDGLTNLTLLHLHYNSISDIPPLDGLTSLTDLYLNDNSISNISALTSLTNLTTLILSDNSIIDISDLAGLTNLTKLSMNNNSISDISHLAGLTNLTDLRMINNSISEILPLENLTNLTRLELDGNSISNISPLSGLTNLTDLRLNSNSIIDISPLSGLTSLTTLWLIINSISDISPLSGLTSLTELWLISNSISDISALSGLTKLTRLGLTGNYSITDYGPLRTLIAAIEADGRTLRLDITIPPVVANNDPTFTDGTTTTRDVAENTAAGVNIGTAVAAMDSDSGDTLTYTLGGTDATSFSIVSTSGQLQTSAALDYETKTSYSVTVSVSDGKGGSDSITVTINVTDVNENRAPVFTDGESTTRSVAENTGSGVNIGNAVAATDADSSDTLTYSLGGTDASSFSINSATGQLRTSASLDYETKNAYSVTVTVSDGSLTDTINVTINVTDVDENRAPVFTDGESTTRSVAENTGSGVNIGNAVAATDADNNTLTYTLGGTDAASFSIGSTNGQLRTEAALDYETKNAYSVMVTVSDGSLTDTINVTINVTDVDENSAPVFTDGSSTTRSVAENTGSGVNIGSAVAATDADNDILTYTLGGTDASSFSINSANGQLRTRAALDYETKTSYSVTITVSDTKLTDSINVTINIIDVDENRAPSFTDGTSTSRSVAENTASGQNIGNAVGATDADIGDALTYSLSGTDATSFSIVDTSGQLQTKAALDYETKTTYSVTVSVSDGEGGTDSITVTINVTDVDDSYPLSGRTQQVQDAIVAAAGVASAADVTAAHLAEITSLELGSKGITTLQDGDFDGLTALTMLALGNNSISEISTLTSLTNLTTLYLFNNSISDISPLSGLTNLTTLALDNNSISNISTLTSLTNLTTLRLTSNSLSDILTLKDLTSLTTLWLNDTSISDISHLENLTNLTTLYLSANSLSDITKLSGLTKLTTLYLNDTSISDISPLTSLTSLTDLQLGQNNISDISALENLTSLRYLNLDRNSIINISVLAGMTDLRWLELWNNSIVDISALENLTELRQLFLENNDITDYGPLRRLIAAIEAMPGRTLSLDITIPPVVDNSDPTFTDGTTTTRSVAENTAADQNIGTAVAATDADTGDTLTYTLGGTDATSFSIVSTSGQLQTRAALDYETKNTYTVIVSVSDGNSGTDSITVTINVITIDPPISERTLQVQNAIVAAAEVASAADVTAAHLAEITILELGRKEITTLQDGDFDGLTALTTLALGNNSISDISSLTSLTSLTTLYLNSNSISEISPLSGLTNLTTLALGNNSIIDISTLTSLTNLTTLRLTSNSLSDILTLKDLTSLTTLWLNDTSISDISHLENLTNLTKLYLSSNSLNDISKLSGLTKLTTLYLNDNSIIDISPLTSLTSLTTLWLHDNSLSDISPLEHLINLTTLYLNDNSSITDYGPLRRLIAAIVADGRTLTHDITIPDEDNNGAPALASVPMSTSLLANYPNPFNPETWIPYQLSKSADVVLTIYNMRGVVVRQLELGHQPAGAYMSRSRAIHWDGRNSIGEKVATGVYFYTLAAGDFTATRKMLIRK